MSGSKHHYYSTGPDGKKQIHYVVAAYADGSEIAPENYYKMAVANLAARRLVREQAKIEGRRVKKSDYPQLPHVYCLHCKARKHLQNTTVMKGRKRVLKSGDVGEMNLMFVHYGQNTGLAPKVQCPDYRKESDSRYKELPENKFRAESRAAVKAELTKPAIAQQNRATLEKMLGPQSESFLRDFWKKAMSELLDTPVLATHPELFPALAVVNHGPHPHYFPSSGRTHQTEFKMHGDTQTIEYPGHDGNTHLFETRTQVKLWYVNGFAGRKPGEVTNWVFPVTVNDQNLPLFKTAANSNDRSDNSIAPQAPPLAASPQLDRMPVAKPRDPSSTRKYVDSVKRNPKGHTA